MGPYDDIINRSRHVSKTRPPMLVSSRAAQFAPFAALSGHDAAIKETARLTDEKIELDEDAIVTLNMKLSLVAKLIASQPIVTFTYFQKDKNKKGGQYVTAVGAIKKIDDYEQIILMQDGTKISIEEVIEISGDLFEELF